MQIALDASILETEEPTGVEKAFNSLLQALHRTETPHQFFLVSPNPIPKLKTFFPKFQNVHFREKRGSFLWRERYLPSWIRKNEISLWHSPVSAFPLLSSCPSLVTVHEIPWLERDTRGDEGTRLRHKAWTWLDAHFARRIVCVSQKTADHFLTLHPSAKNKVKIIHHGVEERFFHAKRNPEFFERLGVRRPYFLFVGRSRRKKNLANALKAFDLFLRENSSDHLFLIAGARDSALEKKLEASDRILFLGYFPDEQLPALYAGAEALLYLSLSEGFGLPPLEAMACATPVIAADRGALPETTGQAALLVSPDDPQEIAAAMGRLFLQKNFRNSKIEEGKKWTREFDWNRTASRYLNIYEEVMKSNPR